VAKDWKKNDGYMIIVWMAGPIGLFDHESYIRIGQR